MTRRARRVTVLLDTFVSLAALASRKGPWHRWYDANVVDQLHALGHRVELVRFHDDRVRAAEEIRGTAPDVVFNLSQASFDDAANEYHSAALLELLQVPYTGAGPKALLLARDKFATKILLRAAGIDVPAVYPFPAVRNVVVRDLPSPVIVKPRFGAGSQGVTKASLLKPGTNLLHLLQKRHAVLDCPLVAEEFIEGRELSVGVVEDPRPRALTAYEWYFAPKAPRFVTEQMKWYERYRRRWGVQYEKAVLDPATKREVARVARAAFVALDLRDYGSVDMRLTPEGKLFVVDVNANPGLWPRQGRWNDISFAGLIERIVSNAMGRRLAAPRPARP